MQHVLLQFGMLFSNNTIVHSENGACSMMNPKLGYINNHFPPMVDLEQIDWHEWLADPQIPQVILFVAYSSFFNFEEHRP